MFLNFANPLLLFGLTAISVPIVIHLLNRRKFERVAWAAMRFLRISVEQNQRRMRIEDILLLILRCLLITLLAMALAQPVLRAASSMLTQARSTAVIVLDNSYSMTQTDGVQSRFDGAKKAAGEVIRSMPVGSSVAVLLGSDKVAPLIPEPTYDLSLAGRQIQDAPLFDRTTNLFPAVKAAFDVLAGRPAVRKEVYIITDGQAAGWRQLNEIKALLETHKREVRTHLLIVANAEQRNLGITALRLEGGLCPVNVPLHLEVRVRNYGKLEARDVNVAIAVDSDPPMDQASISVIPGGEERSVSLFAKLRSDGHHTITAKIDADHLPADDARSVALRAVKEVKVLLIDGDSGREPRESEVFFLKAALQPVPRAERDDYFIKVVTRNPTELDAIRFEDFDAVISANVTDFGPAALAQLANYVRTGGALWVFPGDNINVNFYNEQLYKRFHLLPVALGQTRGDAASQEKLFNLQDRNHDHAIASLWRDPAAGTLSSARFFKAFDLVEEKAKASGAPSAELGPRTSAPRVVLRFQDNQPAMIEQDVGQGRIVVFASTADTAWNDLGARAGIFVPLVHRTLGHLVARQDEHLTVAVGQPFVHISPVELMGKDALITKAARRYAGKEQGDELHESRRIEMLNGIPTLQFSQTDYAGAYDIKVGDAAHIRFAAQSNPEESSLETLTGEQSKLLAETAHVVNWQPGTPLRDELEEGRIGTPLWYPLALAALILAALETFLAHWFSKSK